MLLRLICALGENAMHCAFCWSQSSGYPDGHWEDCGENLLLCRECVEKVALGLMEEGRGELVNKKLRETLEAGVVRFLVAHNG